MPIVHTGETEYDKELKKWNTPKRLGGYGPDGYERFPQMLYKAFVRENGKVQCMEAPPQISHFREMSEYLRAEALATAFTNQCQCTVRSEGEYDRARKDGWRDTAKEALDYYEHLQQDIATAAAEANFAVTKMTPKAQAERAKKEAATDKQIPE